MKAAMKFIPIFAAALVLTACSTLPEPQKDSVTASAGVAQLMEQTRQLISDHKYTEAMRKASRAQALNPDNAEARYAVAVCHSYLHEYEQSITASLQAARYRSKFLPDIYLLLGAGYERTGEPWNALRTYREASRRFPDNPELRLRLALVYLDLDKPELAAEALKNVLYLDPLNPDAHFHLGMLYSDYGYRIPSLLALGMALVLEPVEGPAKQINDRVDALLGGNVVWNEATGTLNSVTDASPKTDEGDFTAIDAALSDTRADLPGRGIPAGSRTMIEAQYQALFRSIQALHDEQQGRKFVADFYLPMYRTLFDKGLQEAFINRICLGRQDQAFKKWIEEHPDEAERLKATIVHYNWPVNGVLPP